MHTTTFSNSYLNKACWIFLSTILALFIGLGLIKLIVFLLFIYLINELLIYVLHRYLYFLPKTIILYLTIIIFLVITTILLLGILPAFIRDLPQYVNKVYENINNEINIVLQQYNIPFDLIQVKTKIFTWLKSNISQTITYIQKISMNIFLFIMALIINFVMQYNNLKTNNIPNQPANNLLDYLIHFTVNKISAFYLHFKTVMSAQLIISLINTLLTFGILLILEIPHKVSLLVLVFIFGLLPVIGNIISNTIICSAAFIWAGMWQVVAALIFLVSIHKLEYVLNSKIIGHFTAMPIYITLLALLIGESLFHISGMIIAVPTVLFIREELQAIKINNTH